MKMMRRSLLAVVLGGLMVQPLVSMAAGDVAAGKTKFATCAACHGADGKGNGGAFPVLTHLNAADAEGILTAFHKGDKAYLAKHKLGGARYAVMAPQTASLSPTDIADLAAYIATLGGGSAQAAAAPAAAAPAAAAPASGTIVADANIGFGHALYSSCAICHGANGEGGKLLNAPKLSGLPASAVSSMLGMYKKGQQLGPYSYVMNAQAKYLTPDEIRDLSAYVSQMNTPDANNNMRQTE
ncbi:MAG: c-type cytochrome [Halothiobacillus sp.]|jgi:cytochrome c553|uniref:c-type cytochrome n=1 Tax=Halothiobacillus sp. TaxID=1891311 RepID=UPI002AD42F15|nr:c-type cytochrome [Halothiobacillus sp.]MDA3876640.1 c-type cytochrome [Halothiobacillus sp.]